MKGLGTVLVWFIFSCMLSAQQHANDFLEERVSLTYQKTPLRQIITDLDSASSFDFNYFDSDVLNQKVSLDLKGETLEHTLEQLFADTDIKYLIKGNHVLLKRKLVKLSLQGEIVDKDTGEPLSLAAVSIKGKPIGIVSNPDGQFGLMLPSDYINDTLYVTMLGYKDYKLNLNKVQSGKPLNIALETENHMLEEIIIFSDIGKWQWAAPKHTEKTSGKNLPMGLFTTLASLEIPARGLNLIDLRCGTGKLKVVASKDNSVKVNAEILTRSLSEKETLKFIKRYLELSYKIEGDTAFIRSFFSLDKPREQSKSFPLGDLLGTPGSKINLTVALPPQLFFKLQDGSGSIEIEDLKNDLWVVDGSGSMQIKSIRGNVRVIDGSGFTSISDVKGNVFIKDRSGHLELRRIKGDLIVDDNSGGLTLSDIGTEKKKASEISIKDNSGGIHAKNLMGTIKLRDTSGRIYLSQIKGSVTIDDRSGGIHVHEVSDSLKIKDRSGKINTSQISSYK